MSKVKVHPFHADTEEKIKALQYIFDVARQASVPGAVHDQTKTYAQFLADAFNPPAVPEKEVPAKEAAGPGPSVAEAIEAAKKGDVTPPAAE